MSERANVYIDPTADVHPSAIIGEDTKIWKFVQVREEAVIGSQCVLSMCVYVDRGVRIGEAVKIQNGVPVYTGVTIEDGVFVGPHVCFTNDLYPRAVNQNFEPAGEGDWKISETLVRRGASIGANATIIPGITIGEYALIGAGSVVRESVPDYALVVGNPGRVIGQVDESGRRV